MIRSQDRSRWFGASDTARVMGPWSSRTFARWWAVKLGLIRERWTTLAMQTGTAYEHPILEYLGVPVMDRQIRLRCLRLRVNLDGEDEALISEVKTYGGARRIREQVDKTWSGGESPSATLGGAGFTRSCNGLYTVAEDAERDQRGGTFRVTRPYWMQAQVEMFAAAKSCRIVAYRLEAEDYRNWLRPIDGQRLSLHPVPYDRAWVEGAYLPRLEYLAWCLKRGVFPCENDL